MTVPLFVNQELSRFFKKRENNAMEAVEDLSEEQLKQDPAEDIFEDYSL